MKRSQKELKNGGVRMRQGESCYGLNTCLLLRRLSSGRPISLKQVRIKFDMLIEGCQSGF
jgi:hypothetical protein